MARVYAVARESLREMGEDKRRLIDALCTATDAPTHFHEDLRCQFCAILNILGRQTSLQCAKEFLFNSHVKSLKEPARAKHRLHGLLGIGHAERPSSRHVNGNVNPGSALYCNHIFVELNRKNLGVIVSYVYVQFEVHTSYGEFEILVTLYIDRKSIVLSCLLA